MRAGVTAEAGSFRKPSAARLRNLGGGGATSAGPAFTHPPRSLRLTSFAVRDDSRSRPFVVWGDRAGRAQALIDCFGNLGPHPLPAVSSVVVTKSRHEHPLPASSGRFMCHKQWRNGVTGVLYWKRRARVWLLVPALVALTGSPPVLVSHVRCLIGTSPRWLIEARQRVA